MVPYSILHWSENFLINIFIGFVQIFSKKSVNFIQNGPSRPRFLCSTFQLYGLIELTVVKYIE